MFNYCEFGDFYLNSTCVQVMIPFSSCVSSISVVSFSDSFSDFFGSISGEPVLNLLSSVWFCREFSTFFRYFL